MKNIIKKRRIIYIILFFAVCFGFIIISFSFRNNALSPQSGGWQLQTNLQTLLNGRTITDMTFLDSLTGFAVTNTPNNDTGFVMKTTNGGNNWFKSFNNIGPYGNEFLKIMFATDSIGYACGGGGYATICKTTDRGTTWVKNSYGWATDFIGMSILGADTIYLADENPLVGGVFRSTNGGVNWQRIYNGGQYNPQNIYMINALTGFYSQGNTYKTTDGGFNWTQTDNSGFIYMKFLNDNTGFRLNSIGVQKTTNCGLSWSTYTLPRVPGTNSTVTINNLSFIGSDTIWASGTTAEYPNPLRYFGVLYKTTNGGLNWGYQIPDTSTIHIPRYYFVNFVGLKHGWTYHTLGLGIHTTVGGDSTIYLGVRQISSETPERYSLEQNYPNPFNSISKIKYQISKIANIKIMIYDVTGKEIYTAVNEKQTPGIYETTFDGSFLSSGVYFYQLTINNEQLAIKKMVLIK